MRLIYEDDDLLVVEKPVGMLSAFVETEGRDTRGEGYQGDDLFSLVKRYVRESSRSKRRVMVYVVHRLDREVSGLIVFAKSARGLSWLKDDLRHRRLHRVYHAVVEGEIPSVGPSSAGTVQSLLREVRPGVMESVRPGSMPESAGSPATRGGKGHARPRGPERSGPMSPDEGKPAVTHWRSTHCGRGRSLVQVRLETGRKNQIRVHLRDLGHPIVGDRKYGSTEDPVGRVCLHASELSWTHALTGKPLRFRSAIPGEFLKLVNTSKQPEEESADAFERPTPPAASLRSAPTEDAGWNHVAGWYDRLIEEGRSDHFERVIIPGTLRLAAPREGMTLLDVACGQGAWCRRLSGLGVRTLGVDAAPRLIEAARRADPKGRYAVCDARSLSFAGVGLEAQTQTAREGFDAATCIMALMNIEPLGPVMRGIWGMLRPGGRLVGVILHPAFRSPGQTSWGWDQAPPPGGDETPAEKRAKAQAWSRARQYRRVDGYLSASHRSIVMNPGAVSSGAEASVTLTYHRPIQTYVSALAEAGFVVDAIEEWASGRESQPGPRAREENRARQEIPMFLAFRALRVER